MPRRHRSVPPRQLRSSGAGPAKGCGHHGVPLDRLGGARRTQAGAGASPMAGTINDRRPDEAIPERVEVEQDRRGRQPEHRRRRRQHAWHRQPGEIPRIMRTDGESKERHQMPAAAQIATGSSGRRTNANQAAKPTSTDSDRGLVKQHRRRPAAASTGTSPASSQKPSPVS